MGNGVTITDTMPASGLTATSISGPSWSCTQPSGPCTRDFGNTALAAGASYPPLTLVVNVAPNGTRFGYQQRLGVHSAAQRHVLIRPLSKHISTRTVRSSTLTVIVGAASEKT